MAARRKASAAFFSGSISEIKLATLTCLVRSKRSAGSKRPQRDPTRVISFTITGAESMATDPCTVDFITTVPRGLVICTACRKPSPDPVASTTQAYSACGSFLATRASMPAWVAIRSFSLCRPYW